MFGADLLVSAAQLAFVVAVDRADLHDALQRVGQFDPFWRQLLAVAAPIANKRTGLFIVLQSTGNRAPIVRIDSIS